jgi:general secretion pathway protein M
MTTQSSIARGPAPLIAVTVYVALMIVLTATIWGAVADVLEQRTAVATAREALERIESRKAAPLRGTADPAMVSAGSAFLEGPTVTVAGAALLQRVAAAVGNVGGTIQSSQVDVLGTQAKDGFVGLVVSCEMEQPALQKLLYDLEVGMPFLFVDQLDVQVPQTTATDEGGAGRIRVVLGVSGQWQGNK